MIRNCSKILFSYLSTSTTIPFFFFFFSNLHILFPLSVELESRDIDAVSVYVFGACTNRSAQYRRKEIDFPPNEMETNK